MATFRFTPMKERFIGRLPYKVRRKLDSLRRKYDLLQARLAEVDAEGNRVLAEALAALGVDPEVHAKPRGTRVTEDGNVYQECCPCPRCQSELQGLPMVQVVEAMISQRRVLQRHIEPLRREARATDSSKPWLN